MEKLLLLTACIVVAIHSLEMCKLQLSESRHFIIAVRRQDCLDKQWNPAFNVHGYCVKDFAYEEMNFEDCANGSAIQNRFVGYNQCEDDDALLAHDVYDSMLDIIHE